MKKSNKILVASLAFVAVSALSISAAMAYQGDPSQQGPNYSPERHAAMTKAMDNNDYAAWSELMDGRGRVSEVINEDNFSKFAEAHKLAEAGDMDGANAIRQELGLGNGGHAYGKGHGRGHGAMNSEHRGENRGGHFVDANGDGQCDNLK